MSLILTLVAITIVSLISLVGAIPIAFHLRYNHIVLWYLISLACGAQLGEVFLHLLPEIGKNGLSMKSSAIILLGILLFFVLEKFLHFHHDSHSSSAEHHHHEHTSRLTPQLIIIGDGVHNILDGILIASSFLISAPLGWATTFAVIAHEVPHELGDFSVLLKSGWSVQKAMLWNLVSALTAFIGAGIVFVAAPFVSNIETYGLLLATSSFLYISLSDLIPELNTQKDKQIYAISTLMVFAGIALMYVLKLVE